MQTAAFLLFVAFAVIAAVQVSASLAFVRHLLRFRPVVSTNVRWPRTAVLMPLRGADPDLLNSVKRLLQQDYPDYELHVVVQSEDDPAKAIVEQAVRETGARHVRIDVFDPRFDPFGLECSNSKTVQGLEGLDDSFEMIAMISGAVIAYPAWLRDLIAPMVADSSVGATFGNRWFMPREGNWGSLLRFFWNAGAVPIMYFQNMPWGASMAMRLTAIHGGDLINEWKRVIAIDAAAPSALARQGLSIRFVPNVMMVNRDECDVPHYVNFVQRQLTWTRVYHERWSFVIVLAVLTAVLLVAPIVLLAYSAIVGDQAIALWTFSGWLLSHMSMLACVFMLEHGVRRSSSSYRDLPVRWLTPRVLWRMPPALILSQVFHPLTVWRATMHRFVSWRGVKLEIVGPGVVRNPNLATAMSEASPGNEFAAENARR